MNFVSDKGTVEVESFEARLAGVRLPMGLRLQQVQIDGQGLRVEKEPLLIQMPRPGNLLVVVAQKDLSDFLEHESPGGLRDFEVQMKPGELHVWATKNMLLDIRAHAICTLRIAVGSQLHVDLQSVEAMGMGATSLVQSQLEKINPVFDVADLPFRALLDSVEIEAGHLTLRGRVSPPQ